MGYVSPKAPGILMLGVRLAKRYRYRYSLNVNENLYLEVAIKFLYCIVAQCC